MNNKTKGIYRTRDGGFVIRVKRANPISLEVEVVSGTLSSGSSPKNAQSARRERRNGVLTEAEIRRLKAAESDILMRKFIAMSLATGLRPGELLALKWGDVDLKHRAITVRSSRRGDETCRAIKGGERRVPLSDEAVGVLKGEGEDKGEQFVFLDKDRNALSLEGARAGFRRLCTDAGVRPLGLHSLRRTAARALRKAATANVRRLLGHGPLGDLSDY